MKLVNRHLAGDFLRLFAVTQAAFLSILLVVSFFEKLRIFLKYRASPLDALTFMVASVPWRISQTAALAVLVATLLSVSLLSRHGEITAFRCGGVSLRRLALPYLACGLAVSLLTVVLQEVVMPPAAAFSKEVMEIRIRKRPATVLLQADDLWLRLGNRVVHVDRVVPEKDQLVGLSLVEIEDGRVSRRVEAREASWGDGRWVLSGAEVRTFAPEGGMRTEQVDGLPYDLSAGPDDFRIARVAPEEMSYVRLRALVARYRAQGLDTRNLEAGLWGKTSLPFAALVMPLLGFPFALRSGRRGGASAGIALGVGIGFVYWLALAVGLSLGKAGNLPTPVGAWAGNLLFLTVGAILLRRAERV
ncbi:MAG: LPS export ABC transporter permease LptG [Deltaproteobacteria bacterium]|nr:LPS export ABC transporter permease LptG [Deltaproteobacteria bacterium]